MKTMRKRRWPPRYLALAAVKQAADVTFLPSGPSYEEITWMGAMDIDDDRIEKCRRRCQIGSELFKLVDDGFLDICPPLPLDHLGRTPDDPDFSPQPCFRLTGKARRYLDTYVRRFGNVGWHLPSCQKL